MNVYAAFTSLSQDEEKFTYQFIYILAFELHLHEVYIIDFKILL